jgi:hypothetical protein
MKTIELTGMNNEPITFLVSKIDAIISHNDTTLIVNGCEVKVVEPYDYVMEILEGKFRLRLR